MRPVFSVVIPVHDAADTLDECLSALAEQEFERPWEVVIADNGSQDASAEIAQSYRDRLPDLRVVDASGRRGVNHARNIGAGASRGEWIALTDADDVVAPGWLAALADSTAHADLITGSFDEASLNDARSRAWRPPRGTPEQMRPLDFLPFAVGSNCALRRELFEKLGGWDESYAAGGDDVEFSWRAQLAGHRLYYQPAALVRTRYRTRLRDLARQSYGRGYAEARLYRDFRHHGAQREAYASALRGWLGVVLRLPWLLHPIRRGAWLRLAAARVGRLHGSLACRVGLT